MSAMNKSMAAVIATARDRHQALGIAVTEESEVAAYEQRELSLGRDSAVCIIPSPSIAPSLYFFRGHEHESRRKISA